MFASERNASKFPPADLDQPAVPKVLATSVEKIEASRLTEELREL